MDTHYVNLVREGLQGGGPNAYNLAEVSPCGDQVHHKIAEICRSENSSDTSPSRCAAVRFPASLARFALLIGSIHPRP
jgi:hypothetical protein